MCPLSRSPSDKENKMIDDNQKLKDALIGRKIVSAQGNLVLDDGSVISFDEYGDCCAWADVERLATLDNVITDVRIEESDGSDYTMSIYALAEGSVDTEIIHIVGNEGSGCYTFGVRINLDGVEVGGVEW